ncbi:unnamed protein product [Leptidea sinapis]|uniref:Uncharacterized protein n=1 Tax=Leptidea sinapis TaxID=189913 RepID=A0A5E4R0U3_9NEOP|nr:unnamed protein product [Leptidea sinapis]
MNKTVYNTPSDSRSYSQINIAMRHSIKEMKPGENLKTIRTVRSCTSLPSLASTKLPRSHSEVVSTQMRALSSFCLNQTRNSSSDAPQAQPKVSYSQAAANATANALSSLSVCSNPCCNPASCKCNPTCVNYMTGYYYYPYGTWMCGPYHVSGKCVPVKGPVNSAECPCACAPCGPCLPCGPCAACGPCTSGALGNSSQLQTGIPSSCIVGIGSPESTCKEAQKYAEAQQNYQFNYGQQQYQNYNPFPYHHGCWYNASVQPNWGYQNQAQSETQPQANSPTQNLPKSNLSQTPKVDAKSTPANLKGPYLSCLASTANPSAKAQCPKYLSPKPLPGTPLSNHTSFKKPTNK